MRKTLNLSAPAILMQSRHWVCRRGKQPVDRYGRAIVPYGDTTVGWDHPLFWTTFEKVVAAYQSNRSLSGIGYIVSHDADRRSDRQIVGVDLDNCRDPVSGWVSPWALDILQKLDSPTGVSISGTGYRAFCLGKLPDGLSKVSGHGVDDLTASAKANIMARKPTVTSWNGLEIYCGSPRHLSVTGLWLAEYPTEMSRRARELADIAALYRVKPQVPPKVIVPPLPRLTDEKKTLMGGCVCDTANRRMISLADFKQLVSITDVIDTTGFTLDSRGELVGSNPILGSSSGHNLVVDPVQGIWISFHDGIQRGGTVCDWLACACGAVAWDQAGSGALRDASVIREMLQYAVECGLISESDAFPT